jgi:hypothetical protein
MISAETMTLTKILMFADAMKTISFAEDNAVDVKHALAHKKCFVCSQNVV